MERVFSRAALLFVSVFFACQEVIHAATGAISYTRASECRCRHVYTALSKAF